MQACVSHMTHPSTQRIVHPTSHNRLFGYGCQPYVFASIVYFTFPFTSTSSCPSDGANSCASASDGASSCVSVNSCVSASGCQCLWWCQLLSVAVMVSVPMVVLVIVSASGCFSGSTSSCGSDSRGASSCVSVSGGANSCASASNCQCSWW